jgi:glycosyltransferase involved in cell wall biosynthesis
MLSVLIPTLPRRAHLLNRLLDELQRQRDLEPDIVQVLVDDADERITIGEKRNRMLEISEADYIVFIDDDDRIAPNYLQLIMRGIRSGEPTHCSLTGEITFDGQNPKPFIHSTRYKDYWEDQTAYYRYPNHLNVVRADIAKRFKFPHWKLSEDTNWATQLRDSGLLTNEYWIDETIYFYDYVTDKKKHGL